ncbi:MAG: enoyl-CoA hydratase/isomerase family protein [Chlorobi bacterium]|nr:enoyl-CoA hydratase/isomerase family protein [Chlorobiota bacterium]
MPEYQRLEVERVQSAGFIYLNRPEKRNALDSLMVAELHDAVQEFGADDSIRSIVIAGRGKAFCAGADLAYLQQMAQFTPLDNMNDSASLARTLRAIYEVPKPVIARVHGPAIAGGCGLATVCDIVVAVESASFGYTEVKIGFIPAIVMAFLIRKSQQMQTRELLLSGRIITATEAAQRGLVTTVIPGSGDEAVAALDAHISNLTAEFAAASGSAIALTKQMLTALDGMPLDSALDYASRMNALARMTPDCQAGIARFLNR